jgi:hypothetical protein
MTQREVLVMVAVGVGMITAGTVWLWGAVPLVVIGALVLIASIFIEF